MDAVAGIASRAMRRLLSGSEIPCAATGRTFRARAHRIPAARRLKASRTIPRVVEAACHLPQVAL
jgi:hypothetical protein